MPCLLDISLFHRRHLWKVLDSISNYPLPPEVRNPKLNLTLRRQSEQVQTIITHTRRQAGLGRGWPSPPHRCLRVTTVNTADLDQGLDSRFFS